MGSSTRLSRDQIIKKLNIPKENYTKENYIILFTTQNFSEKISKKVIAEMMIWINAITTFVRAI